MGTGVPGADASKAVWEPNSPSVPLLQGTASSEAFELHLAAIEYSLATSITIRDESDIKSTPHWSQTLEPFDHQVRNLITFCRRAPVALIADDVGLGKTISAGLIISELMTRQKVRRVLVLAPKLLVSQWQQELGTKFGIDADACGGEGRRIPRSVRRPGGHHDVRDRS